MVTEIVNPKSSSAQTYFGTVVADVQTDLGFPLNGTMVERPAEVGDEVERDALLAILDPEDLDSDLVSAKAGLAVARANLNSVKLAADTARKLEAKGVDSASQREDAERALTAAQAQVEQAEASVERAKDARSLAELRSPHDGIVVEVLVEPGATVTVGQPILRFASKENREVVIDLTETDVTGIPIGTKFITVLASAPEVQAEAVLESVDQLAEQSTRTRQAHLSLVDPPEGFRLGALAQVVSQLGQKTSFTLPKSAFVSDGGKSTVWLVDRSNSKLVRTEVETGIDLGARIEVTKGLSAGDEVLVKGAGSVKAGQTVGPRVK